MSNIDWIDWLIKYAMIFVASCLSMDRTMVHFALHSIYMIQICTGHFYNAETEGKSIQLIIMVLSIGPCYVHLVCVWWYPQGLPYSFWCINNVIAAWRLIIMFVITFHCRITLVNHHGVHTTAICTYSYILQAPAPTTVPSSGQSNNRRIIRVVLIITFWWSAAIPTPPESYWVWELHQ